jgi:hypothetical protein
MPKKTKREKILAEYRKKIKQIQQIQLNQDVTTNNKKIPVPATNTVPIGKPITSVITTPQKTLAYQESEYDKLLAKFTSQDLRKTFFITLFIIALEFFIYYVNLKK